MILRNVNGGPAAFGGSSLYFLGKILAVSHHRTGHEELGL